MAVMTIGTNASPGTVYPTDPGVYYDKRFLDRLTPQLYFEDMCEKRPLPKNSGTLIVWHRLNKLSASTTPLTEGTNPSEQSVATTRKTAEPLEYGAFCKLSSKLNLEAINPVVEEVNDELADQAALSRDTLLRNAFHTNLTNQFGGGAANEAAVADSAVMNAAEVRKAVFTLRDAKVRGFEGNLYKAIITPAQWFDLSSDTAVGAFIDIHKYTNPTPLMNGEIGQLWGVRFVVSQNYSTGTGATDETYRAFFFGKGAVGISEISGAGIKTIRQPAGSNGDPLEMFTTLGWKMTQAQVVLDANRAIEVYTGSAAT